MSNALFLTDWNNPTALAPKPVGGGGVNYSSLAGNPGIKPIVDQFTDELKNLYNELDATIATKGLKFDNLSNNSVQAENIREKWNFPVQDKLFVITNGTVETPMTQVVGQSIIYKEIAKWQAVTNFRNFTAGIDNITTEINANISLTTGSATNIYSLGNTQIYTPPASMDDYKQIRFQIQVSPDNTFATTQVVADRGVYLQGGQTIIPLLIKGVDINPKNYQNPWYRVVLYLRKNPTQSNGVSMTFYGYGDIDINYKCTNKNL